MEKIISKIEEFKDTFGGIIIPPEDWEKLKKEILVLWLSK